MYFVGQIIGSIIGMFILYWIVESLGFRKFEPKKRATLTAFIAWILAGIIGGFGMADGGPFALKAFLIYLPATLIVWAYNFRKLQKRWDAETNDADVFD